MILVCIESYLCPWKTVPRFQLHPYGCRKGFHSNYGFVVAWGVYAPIGNMNIRVIWKKETKNRIQCQNWINVIDTNLEIKISLHLLYFFNINQSNLKITMMYINIYTMLVFVIQIIHWVISELSCQVVLTDVFNI